MFIFGLIMIALLVCVLVIIVKALKRHEEKKSRSKSIESEDLKK